MHVKREREREIERERERETERDREREREKSQTEQPRSCLCGEGYALPLLSAWKEGERERERGRSHFGSSREWFKGGDLTARSFFVPLSPLEVTLSQPGGNLVLSPSARPFVAIAVLRARQLCADPAPRSNR